MANKSIGRAKEWTGGALLATSIVFGVLYQTKPDTFCSSAYNYYAYAFACVEEKKSEYLWSQLTTLGAGAVLSFLGTSQRRNANEQILGLEAEKARAQQARRPESGLVVGMSVSRASIGYQLTW